MEGQLTTSHLANLEIFAAIGVLGLSLILAVVSFVSYRRLQNRRALFIALGFVTFAIQGAYLVNAAYDLRGSQDWLLAVSVMDLVILLFLYLALRIR